MNINERLELIKRNTVEIVNEEDIVKLIKEKKKPRVYCGYEPNGPLHLGHFVTITKLIDLEKAGFEVVILLADVHALLNRKGGEEDINKEVENWKKTINAIGIKTEIVLGSDFEFKKEYQFDVMKLAQHSTIQRGLRSMQEIARDVENATISQLWYPLMQVVDIKHLKVDVALGGMEQRKVHMIGKDMGKFIDFDFIAIHTPLITSLKGPGQKMSKSITGSGISLVDSSEEMKKTIQGAYCPEREIKDNPVLQIVKLIIFPRVKKFEIKRSEKFGGKLAFEKYEELERIYGDGKLHPMDLKNAVFEYLEKIIAPIREKMQGTT
ncbi:tyrosine--tRNA ligase [Candidatus Pacearchaeota archaeon]|nr:tyrosine--tRNA ligase [Candidatus Pacearchaeota archaeon]